MQANFSITEYEENAGSLVSHVGTAYARIRVAVAPPIKAASFSLQFTIVCNNLLLQSECHQTYRMISSFLFKSVMIRAGCQLMAFLNCQLFGAMPSKLCIQINCKEEGMDTTAEGPVLKEYSLEEGDDLRRMKCSTF